MSSCKYTERISPTECIGDSLSKINRNFENLDYGVCEKTTPRSGLATTVASEITELGDSIYRINTKNSYTYNTRFDSLQASTYGSKLLNDSTPLMVTTFPYTASTSALKPRATFTTVSPTDKPPVMSLYWFASGDRTPLTTFSLNSATPFNKGLTWFNGTATSTLSVGSHLYVGGSFTSVGSNLAEKLARIDLTSDEGTFDSTNPITNLGDIGEVKQIIEQTLIISGLPRRFIIVAGSFENIGIRGRGLLIYNATDNVFHHFYVNGEVNAVKSRNNILWVGGNFNYINTGTNAASVFSGRRVLTNGLVNINLNSLWAGLTTGAIQDRSSVFEEKAVIHTIELFSDESLIYVGGEFLIKETPEKIKCKNLCSFRSNGAFYESLRHIINGPVYKLKIDDTRASGNSVYMYIAGDFSQVYTQTQYYLNPRFKDEFQTTFYNCYVLKLTDIGTLRTTPEVITSWKPNFNGPIVDMLMHDNDANTHVYCYGKQNKVNNIDVNYLVAITKASSFDRGRLLTEWTPSIQNSPSLTNNSLIKADNSIIVGGNFEQINNVHRYNLAKIADTTLATPSLSSFVWDFRAESMPIGMNLSFKTNTYTQRVTAVPATYDSINVSTFTIPSNQMTGLRNGQLLRFDIKRPGNSLQIGALSATNDTFRQSVFVIGYKLDYN